MSFRLLLGNHQQEMDMSMTLNEPPPAHDDTLRIINHNVYYKNKKYKLCDSFLPLTVHLTKYNTLKETLPEFQDNIE